MIKIENLYFTYNSFEKDSGFLGSLKDFFKRREIKKSAIEDFNLEVETGEIVGILGPNGSGKTTLIKLLTGILNPESGNIECNGNIPFKKERAYLKSIGVVIGQKSQLIWDLPAEETLEMLRCIYKIDKVSYKNKLNNMVKLLNLEDKLRIPVRKLSLGERIKFEIICALIHSPKILFLDEPTIGLDITSQRSIHEFLLDINKKDNVTIFLTSHYMKDIETLCDRVIILLNGKKEEDSNINEIINKFSVKDEYIIEFKNFIPDEFNCFKLLDKKKLQVNFDEANFILKNVDFLLIKNISCENKSFEDVVFDIFSEGKKED